MVAGDVAAWELLLAVYGDALYHYILCRLHGDRATADDVRQETLLAAATGVSKYRGSAPMFSWLCGIARHKLVDAVRRNRQTGQIQASIEDHIDEALPDAWVTLGTAPLPEHLVEAAETRAEVIRALYSVREQYRDALVSRYVRGEGVDEIAARLGRTYKATESLLSRAREAFRRRLTEVELLDDGPFGTR
jgi:RNA polymerase sigma-70 factor (ECF subfamily)